MTYLQFHHNDAERCLHTLLKIYPGTIKSGFHAEFRNALLEAEVRVVGYKLFSQKFDLLYLLVFIPKKTKVTCVYRQSIAT